jgi:hypothetical protein
MNVVVNVPTNSASAPKLGGLPVLDWNPARAGEKINPVQLRHHRRGFLEDEKENGHDADDAAPAGERMNHSVGFSSVEEVELFLVLAVTGSDMAREGLG